MLMITGASGRIGRRVAELAAAAGHPLRLMTRHQERAPKIQGAEIVQGDFGDSSSMDAAFAGVSAALIISGSGKPGARAELHRKAFESAARARVGHVIYLSLQGAAADSKYPFSRDHYLSEQYLAAAGLPHTILRDAFYLDMFLERFDAAGVVRGPAGSTPGAFVSREDAARTAAAVLAKPPGGIHNVTGPEALRVVDITERLSLMMGRPLRYEPESAEEARARLSQTETEAWKMDLDVGWFEAIAAGELAPPSNVVFRYTGHSPLSLEEYFTLFPHLLDPLRSSHEQSTAS